MEAVLVLVVVVLVRRHFALHHQWVGAFFFFFLPLALPFSPSSSSNIHDPKTTSYISYLLFPPNTTIFQYVVYVFIVIFYFCYPSIRGKDKSSIGMFSKGFVRVGFF